MIEDQRPKTKDKRQKGVVLILTFIILVTLTAITVVFLFMISFQTKAAGHDINSSKALWVAEAGLQRYMYLLTNDAVYQASYPDLTASLGDGSYTVTATFALVNDLNTYYLTSTATVNDISRKITLSAIITSGALDRTIHADASHVDFSNSIGTVDGNVSCYVSVQNEEGMTITGDLTSQYRPKVWPIVNWAFYEALADDAGQVITGPGFTFENATYTGVWYSTHAVTIGDNANIQGSIVAEGNIDFIDRADNVTIVPPHVTNYPALISGGAINTNATGTPAVRVGLQNSTISGLIWADSDVTLDYMKNNVTITGTVLAGNNINMKYSSDFTVTYDAGVYSPFPGGISFTGGTEETTMAQNDWNEI